MAELTILKKFTQLFTDVKRTLEYYNDNLKNEYCFSHQIPIIRIPYTHLEDISLTDLELATSNYIL